MTVTWLSLIIATKSNMELLPTLQTERHFAWKKKTLKYSKTRRITLNTINVLA